MEAGAHLHADMLQSSRAHLVDQMVVDHGDQHLQQQQQQQQQRRRQ
jgi:hypothetical protein